MEDLALFELSSVKQSPILDIFNTERTSFYSYISPISEKINYDTDVTQSFSIGNYKFKNEYTLLFLYDFNNDEECKTFLKLCGDILHNRSSVNISIVTNLPKKLVQSWSNVQYREILEDELENAPQDQGRIVDQLKWKYNVSSLPALVIIKNIKGQSESVVIPLKGYNYEALFKTFEEIIKNITDRGENAFLEIQQRGCQKPQADDKFSVSDFIADLVRQERRRTVYSGYTLDAMAAELGISVKTLSNKRTNNTFTRDECLYIGVRYRVDIDTLNKLLVANNNVPLGGTGRDYVIRRCLSDERYHIFFREELDEILIQSGFKSLDLKKEKS